MAGDAQFIGIGRVRRMEGAGYRCSACHTVAPGLRCATRSGLSAHGLGSGRGFGSEAWAASKGEGRPHAAGLGEAVRDRKVHAE